MLLPSSAPSHFKKIGLTAAVGAVTLLFPLAVHAQNLDIASTYRIDDPDAISGDIISSRPGQGLFRSNVSYDPRVFGILQENPLIVLRDDSVATGEAKPIIRQGDSVVNVTDFNGAVARGDYLTSSPVAGKAMKANESGYVIGIATSEVANPATIDYEGREYNTGQVNIAIRVEYAELSTARSANRLLDQINAAFFKNVQDPEKFSNVVRYILAGLVALVFFFFSFYSFTRSISKGVEAIGRNPLAKRAIQISILLHLGLTTLVMGVGLVIVFFLINA